MKSFLNNAVGIWIVLFALFLPFTYHFFPHLGVDLTNSLSGISEWLVTALFGEEIYVSPTTSDSSAQFVQAILLLIVACAFSFVLLKQNRYSALTIRQFLHTISAYILAFFLLKYGVDKLFQFQFYTPEPNTLFTPLGMLSKDILFWSSMGTSSSYNTFMGLSEIIPALLLLHHRTRLLGGLIALGVLINVLMINVGFDITVKLLSSYLVIISIFVVSPYLTSLSVFFFSQSGTFEKPQMHLSISSKVKAVAKSIAVILIFTEVLFGYFQNGSFNGRDMEKIAHFGSYTVTEQSTAILGCTNINRIHIHSRGYLILENHEGNFNDYPIRVAPDHSLFIRKKNARIIVSSKGKNLLFTIQENGIYKKLHAEKVNLKSLPARDDSFHWTVDGMIKNAQ